MELMFSLIAVFTSLVSLYISIRFQLKDFDSRMSSLSLSNFVSVEKMIKDAAGATKFHCIEPEQMTEAELSADEFAYLLSNITSGGIYYRSTGGSNLRFFGKNEYYDVMFQSEHTRRAWPLIRRCMAPSRYRDRLDSLFTKHGGAQTSVPFLEPDA